jgi:hypothetical protein
MQSVLNKFQIEFRGEENIPSVICNSWKKFSELVESFSELQAGAFVFRGQRRRDWKLTPSLARFSDKGLVEGEIANKQIHLFRQAIRGRVADHSLMMDDDEIQSDELWSIGQHHGLHTPLLDWTQSPFVAMFFAFDKEDITTEADNDFRVVYALNKTLIEELLSVTHGDTFEYTSPLRFIEPRKDDHGRLVSQAGLFTISQYGETLENSLLNALSEKLEKTTIDTETQIVSQYIFKILIKNEKQKIIIKNLRQMNIHHASLFPDLIGASNNCNLILEDVFYSQEKTDLHKMDQKEMEQKSFEKLSDKTENAFESRAAGFLSAYQSFGKFSSCRLVDEGYLISLLGEYGADGKDYLKLSNVIWKELAPYKKQIDWQKKESAIAKMRNVVKVVLRKSSYPEEFRETIVEKIFIKVEESTS